MSLANQNIEVRTVYEPNVNVGNAREWLVLKGGDSVNPQVYPATAWSNANWSFNLNPPSPDAILDRALVLQTQVTFTITATNGGAQYILQPGVFALRSHPLNSVMTTVNCAINSTNFSMQPYQIIHTLDRFKTPDEYLRTDGSILPTMPDKYQTYDDGVNFANNPLATYRENTSMCPRGGYPMTLTNGTTSATIVATLREYVYLPPFIYNGHKQGGLTHVNQMTLNCAFANLAHMLSFSLPTLTAASITITNVAVNFSQPSIQATWITPRRDQVIPPSVNYPYFNLVRYSTLGATLASGASGSTTTNNIVFNSVPYKLYIQVARQEADVYGSLSNMLSATDTFAAIDSISITFNNRTGILSATSPVDLYMRSVQNGLTMQFPEWNGRTQVSNGATGVTTAIGTVGSLICLCPSKDFGLDAGLADGVLGKFQFSCRVNYTNVAKNSLPFEVNIISVEEGIMTLGANSTIEVGVVNPADVLAAPVANMDYNQIEQIYGSGGSFFGRIGDFFKSAHDWVKDNKLVSRTLGEIPVLKALRPTVETLGYGMTPAGTSAGILSGGAALKYSDVASRLR